MSPTGSDPTSITDLRVLLERMSGDIKAILARLDEHSRQQADTHLRVQQVERVGCPVGILARSNDTAQTKKFDDRLSAVERRIWAIPSIAAVVGVAGLVIAIWDAVAR